MEDQRDLDLLAAAFSKVKPYLAMISLQSGFAVMSIVNFLCLKQGFSNYVLVVYRNAIATVVVSPLAFVFERNLRPKMTLSIFLKIMALGLIEPVVDQNLNYLGLKYTSATYAQAMFDIMPAIAFIMAIIFGLEKVKANNTYSQAKIIGTIVTLGGATIMTLYKGPIIEMIWTTSPSVDQNWIAGTLMLLGSCISWSSFFILQSFTLREYPAELSLSSMIVFSGMVQGAAVALVMERNLDAWVIGYDSRLLAPIFSGTIGSAFAYYVQGVVLKERGPVFVTAFSPLSTIIVAVLGSLILAEELHLGIYIGAIVIIVGLYLVIWGKTKDQIVPSHGNDNSIFGPSIAAADHPPLEPNSPMLQEPLV